MNPDLKAAVLGAQQQGAPASPLGSFPELAKMYQSSFQLPQSNAAVQGEANNTAIKLANQKAAQKAAAENYQQINKEDGGYTFIDPTGKEISAFQYARATGQSPDKVLEKSQNLIDQGFVQDYKNLQTFMTNVRDSRTNAKAKAAVDAAIEANPELKKYKGNLQGLIQKFQEHYPTVFGLTGSGHQPVNTTYIPNTKGTSSVNVVGDASSGGI